MPEITSLYMPGQAAADSWLLRPSTSTEPRSYPEDSTGIQVSIGGDETRKGYWQRWHFEFQTMPLPQIPAAQMRDFIGVVRRTLPFNFFWFEQEYWYRTPLGNSDGTDTHLMPFKNCTTPTEVLNGASALTYGFTAAAGTGAEDQLTGITPTPNGGDPLFATFYGKKRWITRFEDSRPMRRYFNRANTNLPWAQWDMRLFATNQP